MYRCYACEIFYIKHLLSLLVYNIGTLKIGAVTLTLCIIRLMNEDVKWGNQEQKKGRKLKRKVAGYRIKINSDFWQLRQKGTKMHYNHPPYTKGGNMTVYQ